MTLLPIVVGNSHNRTNGARAGISLPRIRLVVLVSYVFLAIVLTYPLILHLGSHVPGDGRDDPPLVWNLWWVRYALTELQTNPLDCTYMFYPIGINLTFFTLTILNGLLSVPLQLAAGVVLANNVGLLASYAIAAFGMYLLALDLLSRSATVDSRSGRDFGSPDSRVHLAAFVAGLVYAFAPIKMIFASLGQFNMTSTQWLPFYVLYLLRLTGLPQLCGETDPVAESEHGLQAQQSHRPSPEIASSPIFGEHDVVGSARPLLLRNLYSTPMALTDFSRAHPSVASNASGRLRLLCWLRSDRRGRRAAMMAAVFLLFTAYAEFTFASFLIIFTAVYLAYLCALRRNRLNRRVLERLVLLAVAFTIGFWPILGSMLGEIAREGDYSLTAGWGFADIFAADVLGFFIPSHLHPVFGSLAEQATSGFSYTNFASVGLVVLVLAAVGVIVQRHFYGGHPAAPIAFWGGSAALYAVLSLGPVLHIGGRWVFDLDGLPVRVPLPFIILHYIPLIKANRYPSRLQVLVVLCLAVLVAYGVAWLLRRTRTNAEDAPTKAEGERAVSGDRLRSVGVLQRSFLAGILAAVVVFEYLAIPLPLSDMRVPEVYRRIALDNHHAPVLQLPISWRNSFQFIPQRFTELPRNVNTVVMFQQFYQTTHQGPILSGNTSRNPEFKLTYFLEAPIIRSIVALEEGRAISQEQMAYDRSIAPDVLRFFGFRYIVLHPPLVGGPVEQYVRAVFPVEPIPADQGLSAYRLLPQPPVARLEIDMSDDLSRLYRAEGWGEPQQIAGRPARWTDRPRARLLLPLPDSDAVNITIEAMSPQAGNSIGVWLNGRRLLTSDIGTEWSVLRMRLPEGSARPGLNDLVIEPSIMSSLPPVGDGKRVVGQTGVAVAANIVVHSAGLDAGGDLGFAHVYVNGKDVIKAQRGINVAILDAGTGQVEQRARFDLLGDAANDARFLDFIKAVPDGRLVAVAVMDDASVNFGDGSRQALRLIGVQADLRGRFRHSYAAIGVKGAAPGQALEQWAQGRPASVSVGAHVFGRSLGVAVSRVTVDAQP